MSSHWEDASDRLRLRLLLERLLRAGVVNRREASAIRRVAQLNRDLTGIWPDSAAVTRQLDTVFVPYLEARWAAES